MGKVQAPLAKEGGGSEVGILCAAGPSFANHAEGRMKEKSRAWHFPRGFMTHPTSDFPTLHHRQTSSLPFSSELYMRGHIVLFTVLMTEAL